MKKIKIAAVVGSLRKASLNRQLAEAAAALCGDELVFEILDYQDLPFMNEDIEFPAPAAVQRLRAQLQEADGIWLFSPEYNHGISGVLKNFLDWMSRPDEAQKRVLNGKPAAVSGITPGMSGTLIAQDQLVTLLSFLNMRVMNVPRLTIPNALEQVTDGKLVLKESEPFLAEQCRAFINFIENNESFK